MVSRVSEYFETDELEEAKAETEYYRIALETERMLGKTERRIGFGIGLVLGSILTCLGFLSTFWL